MANQAVPQEKPEFVLFMTPSCKFCNNFMNKLKPKADLLKKFNIVNIDNFKFGISIKNENNNIHRVIDGILDTHTFFSSNYNSNMCSYIDNWSIIKNIKYQLLIKIFKYNICILHHIYIFIKIFKKYSSNTISEACNQWFVIICKFLFKVICV